ncbi:MAG TPA: hypothetical protein P5543_07155 [Planctomycetota bacterium]|nr:hypothetical protein [Planctomycetota bacterium]
MLWGRKLLRGRGESCSGKRNKMRNASKCVKLRRNACVSFALGRITCEHGFPLLWGESRANLRAKLLWGKYTLGRRRKLAKKEKI